MNNNIRHSIYFLVVLISYLVLGALVRAHDVPRYDAINFYGLKKDNVFSFYGLTEQDRANIKTAFIEKFPPAAVGAFGCHIIDGFSVAAFPKGTPGKYFYNYNFPHMSLLETRDYLAYLASIDKLPGQLVIVSILDPLFVSTAHISGLMILDKSDNLPSDIVNFFDSYNVRNSFLPPLLNKVLKVLDQFEMYIKATYNYKTLLLGLLKKDDFNRRVFSLDDCRQLATVKESTNSILPRVLPKIGLFTVLEQNNSKNYCSHLDLTLLADGSRTAQEISVSDTGRKRDYEFVVDRRIDNDSRSELQYGDEKVIAGIMRDINRIVTEKGRKVVFVITPLYKEGHNLPGEILSNALKMVPDLNVIDHRYIKKNENYFIDHEHPSNEYFSYLVKILQSRKLIELSN